MTKSQTKLIALFGILFAVVAIVATVTISLISWNKKKSEKELEQYLDGAIQ